MELNKDVIIVDNFYNNPDVIRNIALSTNYPEYNKERNFPGQESEKSYYTNRHIESFEKILNKRIDVDPSKYVFGKFRYSVESDKARTNIHLDWNVDWTAIVYLSLDKDAKGQLGIYKMKDYNLSNVPNDNELKERFDCESIKDFDARYIMPVSKDLDKWELIYSVDIKYNRLVLFKGSEYFHAITEQFGNSIQNGRITQNFFFNEKR